MPNPTMYSITINGVECSVEPGTTIFEAARSIGIEIPSLCRLEGQAPTGACRVCVVEVEHARNLPASCSTPVMDGMVVHTNSARARQARRAVLELLLSEHDGDCRYCERTNDCELQEIAHAAGIRELRFEGEVAKARVQDTSTPALIRDAGKCIKCRRCVTVCNQIQGVGALNSQFRGFGIRIGPAFDSPLSQTLCVQCGQCAAVCPVGAIVENRHVDGVWAALADPKKHVVVQTAPAIRAALGECFGMPPGTRVTGRMCAALRRLGFNKVFDTNFTADLTILEEGTELLMRLKSVLHDKKPAALPQYTSCSPGWISFVEGFYPDIIENISSCKSPQQMFGALAKTYYAEVAGIPAEDIVVVSVMPCTAKKFEAGRPEMNSSGFADVDYVLTTRELGSMILEAGIDFPALPDEEMDTPLGLSSGAADIFANTGGVMEAALRTVHEVVTGRPIPTADLHIASIAGLEGVKEASVTVTDPVADWAFLDGVEMKFAVAHGLGNARKLIERIKSGEAEYHFIEVMTCPGGCIGGGGQPRFTSDDVRRARIAAIYAEDEGKELRASHKNPAVASLYKDFLGEPLGHLSHELLHTTYAKRVL